MMPDMSILVYKVFSMKINFYSKNNRMHDTS